MADLPTGTVTFLFTDIEGSTRLWEQQPGAMKADLARHDALLRAAIEEHGGCVFKTVGDGFHAAFVSPLDAVQAAALAQRLLHAELKHIRVRIAIHQGEAGVREGDYSGPALNRIARLLAAGHGGQVLLSEAVVSAAHSHLPPQLSLRLLGRHRLRDIPETETIFQLEIDGLPSTFPPLNTLDVAFRRGAVRAAGIAAIVLAVVTGLAGLAWRTAQAEQRQRRRVEDHLYVSNAQLAQELFEAGRTLYAEELLRASLPVPGEPDRRGFEWFYLWNRCHVQPAAVLAAHPGGVRAVAASPDGSTLATGGQDRAVRLWDLSRREQVAVLQGHTDGISALAFSSDGKLLATASVHPGELKLWDPSTRRLIAALPGGRSAIYSLAFSPDGRLLAGGGGGSRRRLTGASELKLWDVTTRRPVRDLRGHQAWVGAVAFAPDGKLLASTGRDGTVRLWQAASGRPLAVLEKLRVPMYGLAFSPDGKKLAVAGVSSFVDLWSVPSRSFIASIRTMNSPIRSLAFSPDGRALAVAGGINGDPNCPGEIRLWDLAARRLVGRLAGDRRLARSVAFSTDGRQLISGSDDGSVRLWPVHETPRVARLGERGGRIVSLARTPGGQTLALVLSPRAATVRNAGTGEALLTIRAPQSDFAGGALSPTGSILAAERADGAIETWSLSSRRVLGTLVTHPFPETKLAFSPDGRMLATGWMLDPVQLWDAPARRLLETMDREALAGALAFAADGRTLAIGGSSETVSFWSLASRRKSGEWKGLMQAPESLAYSADGKRLATGYIDGVVQLWDPATSRPVFTVRTGGRGVSALAFSPDGASLLAGSESGTLTTLSASLNAR